MDRFGASDAWAMFAMWAFASGHDKTGYVAAFIVVIFLVLPDKR